MPRVTIFVREDDMEAFNAIVDRPGWLHDCITLGPEKHTAAGTMKRVTALEADERPVRPIDVNPRVHGPQVDPATYIDESEMM